MLFRHMALNSGRYISKYSSCVALCALVFQIASRRDRACFEPTPETRRMKQHHRFRLRHHPPDPNQPTNSTQPNPTDLPTDRPTNQPNKTKTHSTRESQNDARPNLSHPNRTQHGEAHEANTHPTRPTTRTDSWCELRAPQRSGCSPVLADRAGDT